MGTEVRHSGKSATGALFGARGAVVDTYSRTSLLGTGLTLTAEPRNCRHGRLSVDFMDGHASEDIDAILANALGAAWNAMTTEKDGGKTIQSI